MIIKIFFSTYKGIFYQYFKWLTWISLPRFIASSVNSSLSFLYFSNLSCSTWASCRLFSFSAFIWLLYNSISSLAAANLWFDSFNCFLNSSSIWADSILRVLIEKFESFYLVPFLTDYLSYIITNVNMINLYMI